MLVQRIGQKSTLAAVGLGRSGDKRQRHVEIILLGRPSLAWRIIITP
jgi:hypothetical protein